MEKSLFLRRVSPLFEACLSSMLLCYVSTFRICMGVASIVEKIMRNFLYTCSSGCLRDQVVSWEVDFKIEERMWRFGLGNPLSEIIGQWQNGIVPLSFFLCGNLDPCGISPRSMVVMVLMKKLGLKLQLIEVLGNFLQCRIVFYSSLHSDLVNCS